MPQSGNIGEAQVEDLGFMFLAKSRTVLASGIRLLRGSRFVKRTIAAVPAGGQAATIGRVAQTEESKARRRKRAIRLFL